MSDHARLPEVHVAARGLPGAATRAEGPFAVGLVLWRDGLGRLVCTVVAKAAYRLEPGASAPLDAPLPLQGADRHWNDDPAQSVLVPSDLAPFKGTSELVIVGSAFGAAAHVSSVVARVVVGSVDKSIEAFRPRRFRQDGAVEAALSAPRPARFPLRYEHAAAGLDNPVGVDGSRADARGMLPIPELVPASFALGAPGDHVPTVGFGPIAPAWHPRAMRLGPQDKAWLEHPAASPIPHTFPARYFQVAPVDQWLDRELAANERIVLEGLHADHPRLVVSLSGLEPRAIVPGRDPLRLSPDLLFIDTDAALCTLTFRGQVRIDEGARSLRVVVVGAPMGATLASDVIRRLEGDDDDLTIPLLVDPELVLEEAEAFGAVAAAGGAFDDAPDSTRPLPAPGARTSTLPAFVVPKSSPPGSLDDALPFRAPTATPRPISAPEDDEGPLSLRAPPRSPRDLGEARRVSNHDEAPTATELSELDDLRPALPFQAPGSEKKDEEPPTLRRGLGRASSPPEPPSVPPPAWLGVLVQPAPPSAPEAPTKSAPPPPAAAPVAEAPAEPPPAPAPEAEDPGLPLEKYPLARCAAIAARIAMRPEEIATILADVSLRPSTWEALDAHWLDVVRSDVKRGKKDLRAEYDAAFVASLEVERGPITPLEYARLVVAIERGVAKEALLDLRLPEGATLRIRRVWLERSAKDPKLHQATRAAMREAALA